MNLIHKLFQIFLLLTLSAGTTLMAKDENTQQASKNTEIAIFAGGCFWCLEKVYENVPGIISSISGYTGGHFANPTYEQVSAGGTEHRESVQVTYDPGVIAYKELLDLFWHNIDPLDEKGQFCDKGDSYKAAIFYSNEDQKTKAETSKQAVEKTLNKKVVTDILPASTFYPAEEYHQNYASKNPIRYKFYSTTCGRASRLKEVWGKK